MRKGFLVAVMILAFSLGAVAFQNEPDGFRGLKWGDPPGEDMEYIGDVYGKGYTVPDDKMSLGNAQLYMIIYLFYEDRFFGVALYFRGEENYGLLETICKERYGEEELEEGFYEFKWMGQKSFVALHYDIVEETGFLSLNSTVIVLEKTEADNKKEAEKAEGDW